MAGTARMTHPYSPSQMMASGGAMARRKGVITHRVAVGVAVVLFLGVLMGSRVFLTSQITGMRARIAELESRKEFLEAGNAELQSRWIAASDPAVVMARAERELGLVPTETPGPVLVLLPAEDDGHGALASLRASVAQVVTGTMVSLQPRAAHADPVASGGD